MKTCIQLLLVCLLFGLGPLPQLVAQADALPTEKATLKYTDLPGPAVEFTYELPALTKIEGYKSKQPYYRHLFIFGDGNFRIDTSHLLSYKAAHDYNAVFSAFLTNYYARSYSAGIYSDDGDEPPRHKIGPIPPPDSGSVRFAEVVDPGRYLKVVRSVDVKPGDPFVTIISVKHPGESLPGTVRTPLRGQLFFFYNGKMREVSKLRKHSPLKGGIIGTETEVEPATPVNLPFSEFAVAELFHYLPEAASSQAFHYSNFTTAKDQFQNVLALDINGLPADTEMHFFLEMEGSEAMNDQFDPKTKVEIDFLAVLGAVDNPQESPFTPGTPQDLLSEIQQAGIDTLLPQLGQSPIDSAHTYQAQEDASSVAFDLTTGLAATTNRILDAYKSTATLVNVHDPNFLLLESCACQDNQDRYQIFSTVQCENEGYGTTTNVFIDLKLPAGITASDIVPRPLSYHPAQASATNIELVQLAADSIRWQWSNLGLQGTAEHGVGDPRTYAQLQFHMYSSIRPEDLPPMQACIRFNDPEGVEVCTEAVLINLLTDAADLPEPLSCQVGECSDDPNPPNSWPWWLWLLLLLLLVLLLLFLWRR
jgi:hypothetical protein